MRMWLYGYPLPSFSSGLARVLDIGGMFDFYRMPDDPDQADAEAIGSDWEVVGYDLRAAAEKMHSQAETDTDIASTRLLNGG